MSVHGSRAAFVAAMWLAFAVPAAAEGSAEIGAGQGLSSGTRFGLDVLDAATETIRWRGKGDVTVVGPDDVELAPTRRGDDVVYDPTIDGVHRVTLGSDQFEGPPQAPTAILDWDLAVLGAGDAPLLGRLWSDSWSFTAGGLGAGDATDASYYARVPAGGDGHESVIELRFDGLAGFVYGVWANRTGPRELSTGRSPWKSVLLGESGAFLLAREHPLYLNPPGSASYSARTPSVTGASFGQCGFSFTTNVEGIAQVLCDLDDDGLDDALTDPQDLRLAGAVAPGASTLLFSGVDAAGRPVEPGVYDCRVLVTVGTLHHVAVDVETSYPGLRMFEVASGGARTALPMHWDDSLVQLDAEDQPRTVEMPTCGTSPERSPEGGVAGAEGAAEPATDSCPLGNARAWGNFGATSKGNAALLDTYTWIASGQADLVADLSGCVPLFTADFETGTTGQWDSEQP